MIRLLPILALVLATFPAAANTLDCGDNAFSKGEVVTRPPGIRARGPITSVPDSLCADLIEDRPRTIESLSVHVGGRPDESRPGPSRPGQVLSRDRAGAPRQP